MKIKIISAIVLAFIVSFSAEAKLTKNKVTEDYIEKFAPIAIKKMQEHGIPASISLAQGILESGSGQSELAKKSNNHFGIKCGGNWNGDKVYHDDDKKQECFRKYKTPELSFEDHSAFLKKDRYKKLFDLDIRDYEGWAKGLKECGYATDPKYASRLCDIIETYELYNYDKGTLEMGATDVIAQNPTQDDTIEPSRRKGSTMGSIMPYRIHMVEKNGRTKYVKAKKGDTFKSLAKEFDVREWQIKKYNGLKRNEDRTLNDGDVVYITRHKK